MICCQSELSASDWLLQFMYHMVLIEGCDWLVERFVFIEY